MRPFQPLRRVDGRQHQVIVVLARWTGQIAGGAPVKDFNCSGYPLLFSPKWTINFGIEQVVPLGDKLELVGSANTAWRDQQWGAFERLPFEVIPAYWTTDLSLTLRDAAGAMFEDVCILERGVDGLHIFTAGALAYPTDWHLHEKIGQPLAGIHAPVPGFAAKLAAGVDHVFDTLTPARMLTRANWNIVETDTLRYLPALPAAQRFDHVTAANAGETLWLRCERQALRRLPETGAAVFTIGIYREPLAKLPAALVRDLATAVRTLPHAEALRRGTSGYGAALDAYAATR